jgi:phosphoribosylanthranilate isomerase
VTLVKVCGIRTLAEGRQALAAGADWLGFVFWPGSRRYVEPAQAGPIIGALRQDFPGSGSGSGLGFSAVGVFVDPAPSELARVVQQAGIDRLQLCGDEPPATFAATHLPTVKSVRVRPGHEPDVAAILAENPFGADLFLLDTHRDGRYGGTGANFDWHALSALGPRCFVAGGLRPGNVRAALETLAPLGVDVSSGVERPGGGKDPALVRAFVEAVREHDRLACRR